MTAPADRFARARQVADAVLYEGYVLYPYRASARKNQLRWQFGVVAPKAFAKADGSEDWAMQTECLVEAGTDPKVDVRLRFLTVQERQVEVASGDGFEPVAQLDVDGALFTSWDEAVEHEIDIPSMSVSDLLMAERAVPIELGQSGTVEIVPSPHSAPAGRIVRRRHAVSGAVRIAAEVVPGPEPLIRVRVRIENHTPCAPSGWSRDDMARRSFTAVHTLLGVRDGDFLSLADPPDYARAAASACRNVHTWPVLIGQVGRRDVLLSSSVVLSDYPEVSPESPGDMCDATEIDEILALRVMTLTEEEKREARSTDPRAAAIVDRCDLLPAEVFERLHGAVRYLRGVGETAESPKPWWDPAEDASVDPFEDRVWVGNVSVGRGTRVRLRPSRRADAHDLFLAGREALVQAIIEDVDGNTHVAVSVVDEDLVELELGHGRYLYFAPDEVEPLVGAQ